MVRKGREGAGTGTGLLGPKTVSENGKAALRS